MFNLKNWVTAALFLVAFSSISAQNNGKFGHLNYGNLLELMPEVKTANDTLQVFGAALSVQRDSLAAKFQREVMAYQKEADAGNLTPLAMQTREAELQKMQAEGQEFETNLQQLVDAKRQSLLLPIMQKVEAAIKAVGKEGGYSMIFDSSTGATLYALETEDVLPLVKKKLGIM